MDSTGGFVIRSSEFKDNESIPKRFSCDGEDLSPAISWTGAPSGTKSLMLVVEDPDAPMGTFIHWIVYDMPATTAGLERGAGREAKKGESMKFGTNDFGNVGYGGPCPPMGHGRHRYNFVLKAIDIDRLGLAQGSTLKDVERASRGHVLAEARLTGVYQR